MTYPSWERRYRVTTVRPGRLDLFVLTLIDGVRAHIDAIMDYDAAMARAEAFLCDHQCQIKVLPMTGTEMLNYLGIKPPATPEPIDPAIRKQLVARLTSIARDSNDSDARRDAFDLLTTMGVLNNADR